jgi:hypothetical protein
MIGFDFRALIAKKFSIYGQYLIDELNFGNELGTVRIDGDTLSGGLFSPNKWWGTKFATQLGVVYVDAFGIKQLDAQLEANFIRPYTYGHSSEVANWSHYNQPLAHPMGGNTSEIIAILNYQPIQQLRFNAKYIHTKYGADDGVTENLTFGNDITVPHIPDNRPNEYGVDIHQGFLTKINHVEFRGSYQPWHNLFVDFIYEFRKSKSELPVLNSNTHFVSAAVRFNLPHKSFDF